MGSVKEKHYTPDNDPKPYPQVWHRHYFYCDNCGSFDLKSVIIPENHLELKSRIERYKRFARNSGFVIVVGGLLLFKDFLFFWLMILGVLVYMISNFYARRLKSTIMETGVLCKGCQTEYDIDSSFIADTDSNPMNFTKKNIPKPIYQNYTIDVW